MKNELKKKLGKHLANGKMPNQELKEKFNVEKSIWIMLLTFKQGLSLDLQNQCMVIIFSNLTLKKIH